MNKRIFPIPSAYWRIEVLTIQERADIPLTRRDVPAAGHRFTSYTAHTKWVSIRSSVVSFSLVRADSMSLSWNLMILWIAGISIIISYIVI